MIAAAVGLWVAGGLVGFVLAALVAAAGRADREAELLQVKLALRRAERERDYYRAVAEDVRRQLYERAGSGE